MDSQPENIDFIEISEEELKLEKSTLNKFTQPENIELILVIFEASKWEKSIDSINWALSSIS